MSNENYDEFLRQAKEEDNQAKGIVESINPDHPEVFSSNIAPNGKEYDSSAWARFAKGYDNVKGPIENIDRLILSTMDPDAPVISLGLTDRNPNTPWYSAKLASATELYGEEFSHPWTTAKRRLEILDMHRKQSMDELHGHVQGNSGFAGGFGEFVGALANPYTLLPISGKVVQAGIGGALYAGADAGLRAAADDLEITPQEYAMIAGSSLAGGVLAGASAFTINKVGQYLTNQAISKMEFTHTEINHILDDLLEGIPGTEEINRYVLKNELNGIAKAIHGGDGMNRSSKAREPASNKPMNRDPIKKHATASPLGALNTRVNGRLLNTRMNKSSVATFDYWIKEIVKMNVGKVGTAYPERLTPKYLTNTDGRAFKSQESAESALRENYMLGEYSIVKTKDGFLLQKDEVLNIPKIPGKQVYEYRLRAFREQINDYNEVVAALEHSNTARTLVSKADSERINAVDDKTVGEAAYDVIGSNMDSADSSILTESIEAMKNFLPRSSLDDDARPLFNELKKTIIDNGVARLASGMLGEARWITTPLSYAKRMGAYGQEFAERMIRAREISSKMVSDKMFMLDDVYRKTGVSRTNKAVRAYLKTPGKYIPTSFRDISSAAIRKDAIALGMKESEVLVAKMSRRILDDTLDAAQTAGMLSKEAVEGLRKWVMEEGYLPHIYDMGYLMNNKGRERFVKAVTEKLNGYSREEAEQLLKYMSGAEQKYDISEVFIKNLEGDGYLLPHKSGVALLEAIGATSMNARGTHLERSRSFPKFLEEVLDPFLISDNAAIIGSYLDDSYKQFGMVAMFGRDDKIFHNLTSKLEKVGYTQKEIDVLRNTYYTGVGSHHSSIIKTALDQGFLAKRIVGSIKAFEMYKLALSPLVNMGQANINGTTELAKIYGKTGNQITAPLRAYTTALKATFGQIYTSSKNKILKTGARDWADSTGAASSTTILDVAGDLGSQHNTILGFEVKAHGRFEGNALAEAVMGGLDILNNPTKFLRYNQFVNAEKFQRKFAANMGKAMVENLITQRAKLIAAIAKPSKGSKDVYKKRLAAIEEQLNHYGVMNLDNPSVLEMQRASLRFSDKINFVNAPDTLPHGWQESRAAIQLARQFRTFVYHQTRMLKNNVVMPAKDFVMSGGKRGTIAPMITYLTASGGIGMSIDQAKRFIVADDTEFTNFQNYARGQTIGGGMGIATEVFDSYGRGPGAALAALAGPAASDVGRVYSATETQYKNFTSKGRIDLGRFGRDLGKTHGTFEVAARFKENLRERNKAPEPHRDYKRRKYNERRYDRYGTQ